MTAVATVPAEDLEDMCRAVDQLVAVVSVVRSQIVDMPALCDALGAAERLGGQVAVRLDVLANT